MDPQLKQQIEDGVAAHLKQVDAVPYIRDIGNTVRLGLLSAAAEGFRAGVAWAKAQNERTTMEQAEGPNTGAPEKRDGSALPRMPWVASRHKTCWSIRDATGRAILFGRNGETNDDVVRSVIEAMHSRYNQLSGPAGGKEQNESE